MVWVYDWSCLEILNKTLLLNVGVMCIKVTNNWLFITKINDQYGGPVSAVAFLNCYFQLGLFCPNVKFVKYFTGMGCYFGFWMVQFPWQTSTASCVWVYVMLMLGWLAVKQGQKINGYISHFPKTLKLVHHR